MIFEVNTIFRQEYIVTEAVYNGFIDVFHDRNPLHTNEEFARAKGFRGRVMHGNILNGFLSCFVGEALPTKEVIIHTQEIQYKLPVYLHDKLSFEAIVDGVYESVKTVEFKFTFLNTEDKVVAKGKIQIGLFI